jgi:hypothetical protein
MASVAEYKFQNDNGDGFKAAKDRISSELGGGYESNCPMFDSYNYIVITDSCSNPGKAGDICRAYGGKPV